MGIYDNIPLNIKRLEDFLAGKLTIINQPRGFCRLAELVRLNMFLGDTGLCNNVIFLSQMNNLFAEFIHQSDNFSHILYPVEGSWQSYGEHSKTRYDKTTKFGKHRYQLAEELLEWLRRKWGN